MHGGHSQGQSFQAVYLTPSCTNDGVGAPPPIHSKGFRSPGRGGGSCTTHGASDNGGSFFGAWTAPIPFPRPIALAPHSPQLSVRTLCPCARAHRIARKSGSIDDGVPTVGFAWCFHPQAAGVRHRWPQQQAMAGGGDLIHRLRSTATPHMRRRTLHVHKIDPHPRLLSRTSPLAAAPVDGSHFCAATIGGGGPSLWGAAATVTIGRVVAEIRLGRDCNAIRLVTADDHTGPVMYGYGPRAVPCSFVAPPSGQITCNTPTKHAACPNWLRITRRRLSSDESAAQAPRPP